MASIKLAGDTSGEITISAPSVAGTHTLTLPSLTANILTDGAALPAIDGSALTSLPAPAALSTASGSAPSYSARAWVNFNGTGTVAIRESGNVSSITDNGTGDYTVNFTTATTDANYSTTGTSGGVNTGYILGVYSSAASPSTTAVRVGNFRPGVGLGDEAYINVTVHR
jgi:hypothetical protein